MCGPEGPARALLTFRPGDWSAAGPWEAFTLWQAARTEFVTGSDHWPTGYVGYAAEETKARVIASSVAVP